MILQGKVWGKTTPLFNKNNVEVHHIDISKGGYCSKHYHKTKFNQFMVMYGKLKVTIWKDYGKETLEDVSILEAGDSCIVSPGDYHRFEALEKTRALEIYWVELNLNDIVRSDNGGLNREKTTDLCNADVAGAESEDKWPRKFYTAKLEDAILCSREAPRDNPSKVRYKTGEALCL